MARLFDIERNKIVPDAKVLAIPTIKKIWDKDKSVTKDVAFKQISYIVFLCDFHSPYRDIHDSVRSKYIIDDIYEEAWVPDKDVLKAIEVYKRLQETPSMQIGRAHV